MIENRKKAEILTPTVNSFAVNLSGVDQKAEKKRPFFLVTASLDTISIKNVFFVC